MFLEKPFELIKELERSHDVIPKFNMDCVRQVLKDMQDMYQENHLDASIRASQSDTTMLNRIRYRHSLLHRSKRCLLAYVYNRSNRIKSLRWQFGATLPQDIKTSLCVPEIEWFNNYSKILSSYMLSLGDGQGVSLTEDMKPPKTLYVQVRCLVDYGKLELEDGEVILLKQNSQHYLPRIQCETLIRQGILQHIV